MKKSSALLAASLLLNAALVVVVATRSASEQTQAISSQDPPSAVLQTTSPPPVPSAADERAPTTRGAAATTGDSPANARLAHGVRELVAQLRRSGIDEGTVRRLGVALAERLFRLDARALLEPREELEYWETSNDMQQFGVYEPTKLREFQRLRRERVEMLEELFGDVDAEATEHNTINHYAFRSPREFAYAPPDKRLQVIEFFEREAVGVGRTPAQRIVSQHMPVPARELEQYERVRELLGPGLFDDYLLQSSAIASRLRYELAAFQPTRAEFDALVQADYERVRQDPTVLSGAALDAASYAKAEESRREAMRDVLDESRLADYERASDESFRHLDQVARELGLGSSAARSAFAHVERARKQVLALAGEEANLADPKVHEGIVRIHRETQTRVAQELGLQSLSSPDQQMILGPALNIHPQQVARRMFRW